MNHIRRTLPSTLPDLMAFIALAGILVSFAVWALFSAIGAAINGTGFMDALTFPTHEDEVIRLSAVVFVLLGTLAVQLVTTWGVRARRRLERAEARVEELYERSPDAIVTIGPDYRVRYANAQSQQLSGRAASEMVGELCHVATMSCDSICTACPAASVFATGEPRERTVCEGVDGAERWHDQIFYPVLDGDGKVESVVESTRDITESRLAQDDLRRVNDELEVLVTERTTDLLVANAALAGEVSQRQLADEALNESEVRYRQLVESSPDMLLVHREGRIAFLNTPGATLLGFSSPHEAHGLPVSILIEPHGAAQNSAEVMLAVQDGSLSAPTHVRLKKATGELIDVELSVSRLVFEGADAVQCVIRDISDRVRAQATIRRMAYYDALTELPNRTLFRDRLRGALAQARRRDETVAILFVDLDDFKAINDSFGHGTGDRVLQVVGRRLQSLLREEDTVSRQSGDEFTIIARISDRDAAALLAERVREGVSQTIDANGLQVHVSASVGVATFPQDGSDVDELLRKADTAMYVAKEWGHGHYRLYEPSMSESATKRLELEADLRHAITRDEFELHYQPQIDVRDGRVVGIEALLRWNHPKRGMLSPADFIDVIEHAGFIGDVGEWVLNEACSQAMSWQAEGVQFGRVAVNLSARDFIQRDVVENVARALARTGLDPSMLEVEITESIAMYNVDAVLVILHALRGMGVRVAIDDFGTGYSSMNYLKRFPVQTLKIAQEFMRDIDVDQQSAAIATMLIELCHELGLDIVAEGVESQSQLDFIRARGCFVAQGFLLCRPMPADRLSVLLSRSSGGFAEALEAAKAS